MNMKIKIFNVLVILVFCICCTKDPMPNLSTSNQIKITLSSPASIDQVSASLSASVETDNTANIIQKGFCWASTTSLPTVLQSKIELGAGNASFSGRLTGLTPATKYYTKAYIISNLDTVYSEVQTFTTLAYSLSSVVAGAISNITLISANIGYIITSAGGGAISSRGTCWSTSGTPSIANSRTIDGSGLGAYSSTLTGLVANTTYYVRSYATNQAGTAYGTLLQLKTLDYSLPTVGSTAISSITKTVATATSIVSADGGATVTERGICWSSTTTSPLIINSRVISGTGTGSFAAVLTGLTTGVTYYARAYAINSKGTTYGLLVSFKTL